MNDPTSHHDLNLKITCKPFHLKHLPKRSNSSSTADLAGDVSALRVLSKSNSLSMLFVADVPLETPERATIPKGSTVDWCAAASGVGLALDQAPTT